MTNTPTHDDMMNAARELGEQAGKGKAGETQIKFLLKTIEGGYHGVISLDPNKYGSGVDDAIKLAETYVTAQQKHTVFDAKAPNQRKLAACLRTGIKLGSWPKGGNGEPIATVNNLISARQKLRKDPATARKLNDAANTVLSFARAQLKRDQLIPEEEFGEYLFKPNHEEDTAEEIIAGTVKKLDRLISGKASRGTAQDSDGKVINARDMLRKRLSEYAKGRSPQGTAP